MATDHIRYDILAQDALRGVVRRVLAEAARQGLPGDHHFYISFKTRFPGVKISSRLGEKYPDEITIVLQHQFWDLVVTEQGFEVGLSFGNAPEKLSVPFEAVNGFYDPSVPFSLKFEVIEDVAPAAEPAAKPTATPKPEARGRSKAAAKAETGGKDAAPPAALPASAAAGEGAGRPALKVVAAEEGAEKVVSLDTFRKKK